MKIGKHKKGQGSLWGFLAVNYIAFTLLLLTVASLGVLGASLYTRAKAPFPDAEEFLRKAAAGGDEDFARLRVERYLGNGAGAFLFDQTGTLLAAAGAQGDVPDREELDCIPDYDSDTWLLTAEVADGKLVTRIGYGEDGELFVDGYALLDKDLRKTGGSLFSTGKEFTEEELGYLQGKDAQGQSIHSCRYTDRDGRERQAVFFIPQRGIEEYARVYETLDRAVWLFLPAYAAAALFCIWLLRRKTERLLAPLNTAIRNYSMGVPSGLKAYEGPREFEELADNFVQMEEQLRESEEERRRLDEEKRRLLADISHDLKTPLTVIQGYADALRDGMVPEEEREACLRVISQRTQRVNELLLSFHEYSKLEHPQISVHAKRVDLCQTVREYIAGRYAEIELGGFLLEADIPEEPLDCALDPSLFYRAVENIINNAMKYNPPGTCLFVRVQRKGERALVRLGNNGTCIPAELRDKLFLPFATGDSARGGGHGSGLGLAISRRIAELHGGSLILSDPPPDGLAVEFVFDFPVDSAQ